MRRKALALVLVLCFLGVGLSSCAMFQAAKDQPYSTWSAKKKPRKKRVAKSSPAEAAVEDSVDEAESDNEQSN